MNIVNVNNIFKKKSKKNAGPNWRGGGGGLGRVWTKSKLAFFLIFEPFPNEVVVDSTDMVLHTYLVIDSADMVWPNKVGVDSVDMVVDHSSTVGCQEL